VQGLTVTEAFTPNTGTAEMKKIANIIQKQTRNRFHRRTRPLLVTEIPPFNQRFSCSSEDRYNIFGTMAAMNCRKKRSDLRCLRDILDDERWNVATPNLQTSG